MDTPATSPSASPDVDALAQLSFAVIAVLTRASAEHDLSLTQLRVLGILRGRSPSMAALADRLQLDRSSVSGLIDRAERRGLVARRASLDDARVIIVDLTESGSRLADLLTATVNARIEELLTNVQPRDRAALMRLARVVSDVGRD